MINKICPESLDKVGEDWAGVKDLILEIYERYTAANKRFSKLVLTLSSIRNSEYKQYLKAIYIESEAFYYYREMAKKG